MGAHQLPVGAVALQGAVFEARHGITGHLRICCAMKDGGRDWTGAGKGACALQHADARPRLPVSSASGIGDWSPLPHCAYPSDGQSRPLYS